MHGQQERRPVPVRGSAVIYKLLLAPLSQRDFLRALLASMREVNTLTAHIIVSQAIIAPRPRENANSFERLKMTMQICADSFGEFGLSVAGARSALTE